VRFQDWIGADEIQLSGEREMSETRSANALLFVRQEGDNHRFSYKSKGNRDCSIYYGAKLVATVHAIGILDNSAQVLALMICEGLNGQVEK